MLTTGLISTRLKKELPSRLAEAILQEAGVPEERRVSEMRKDERIKLLELLTAYNLDYQGVQSHVKLHASSVLLGSY